MAEGGGQVLECVWEAGGGQRAVSVGCKEVGARRTFNARPKVAFSSGVRSSSALPRERCGIET